MRKAKLEDWNGNMIVDWKKFQAEMRSLNSVESKGSQEEGENLFRVKTIK